MQVAVDPGAAGLTRSSLGDRSTPTSELTRPAKVSSGEPGAAAEIEAPCRKRSARPIARQAVTTASSSSAGDRGTRVARAGTRLEACRMLIEKPPHINRRHPRRDLARTEPGELQPRAMIVLRTRCRAPAPRRRSPLSGRPDCREWRRARTRRSQRPAPARRFAPGMSAAPVEVAARRMVERPFVAAVGDQVAGRDEQRVPCHCAIYRISLARCAPRISSFQRRPACTASSARSISIRRSRSTRLW